MRTKLRVRRKERRRKLAQVTAETRRYNLHILGISESRWTGSGRYRTNTGEKVLYSGKDDNEHHEGVAVILRKGMEKCLMDWKPTNDRLMNIRMKGKQDKTRQDKIRLFNSAQFYKAYRLNLHRQLNTVHLRNSERRKI